MKKFLKIFFFVFSGFLAALTLVFFLFLIFLNPLLNSSQFKSFLSKKINCAVEYKRADYSFLENSLKIRDLSLKCKDFKGNFNRVRVDFAWGKFFQKKYPLKNIFVDRGEVYVFYFKATKKKERKGLAVKFFQEIFEKFSKVFPLGFFCKDLKIISFWDNFTINGSWNFQKEQSFLSFFAKADHTFQEISLKLKIYKKGNFFEGDGIFKNLKLKFLNQNQLVLNGSYTLNKEKENLYLTIFSQGFLTLKNLPPLPFVILNGYANYNLISKKLQFSTEELHIPSFSSQFFKVFLKASFEKNKIKIGLSLPKLPSLQVCSPYLKALLYQIVNSPEIYLYIKNLSQGEVKNFSLVFSFPFSFSDFSLNLNFHNLNYELPVFPHLFLKNAWGNFSLSKNYLKISGSAFTQRGFYLKGIFLKIPLTSRLFKKEGLFLKGKIYSRGEIIKKFIISKVNGTDFLKEYQVLNQKEIPINFEVRFFDSKKFSLSAQTSRLLIIMDKKKKKVFLFKGGDLNIFQKGEKLRIVYKIKNLKGYPASGKKLNYKNFEFFAKNFSGKFYFPEKLIYLNSTGLKMSHSFYKSFFEKNATFNFSRVYFYTLLYKGSFQKFRPQILIARGFMNRFSYLFPLKGKEAHLLSPRINFFCKQNKCKIPKFSLKFFRDKFNYGLFKLKGIFYLNDSFEFQGEGNSVLLGKFFLVKNLIASKHKNNLILQGNLYPFSKEKDFQTVFYFLISQKGLEQIRLTIKGTHWNLKIRGIQQGRDLKLRIYGDPKIYKFPSFVWKQNWVNLDRLSGKVDVKILLREGKKFRLREISGYIKNLEIWGRFKKYDLAFKGSIKAKSKILFIEGILKLPTLDKGLLKLFKKETFSKSKPSSFLPPNFTVKGRIALSINLLNFLGFNLEAFKGILYLNHEKKIKINRVLLCEIPLKGEFIPDRGKFEIKATNYQGDLKRTLSCLFSLQHIHINGPYKLSFQIRRAKAGKNPFEYLEGKINLISPHGKIYKLPILFKLFELLNPLGILKGNLKNLLSSAVMYEDLHFSGFVKGKYFVIEKFYFKSPGFRFFATGNINLVSKKLDIYGGFSPFEIANQILTKVPLLNKIVKKEKGIMYIPFEAKGNIWDPKVTLLPAKGIKEEILDIFSSILNLF